MRYREMGGRDQKKTGIHRVMDSRLKGCFKPVSPKDCDLAGQASNELSL